MSLTIAKPWDTVEKSWQRETKKSNLELVKVVNQSFNEKLLVEDYQSVISKYKTTSHSYNSPWKGVGLISCSGKTDDITLSAGEYNETAALGSAPYIKSILDSLECEKKRVRVMELTPGFTLDWHTDGVETDGCYITRFHVPIITNDKVVGQVSHTDYFFRPGEFGFIDTAFPHRTANLGNETRVHLIIELVLNDFVKDLLKIDLKDPVRRNKSSRCATLLKSRI